MPLKFSAGKNIAIKTPIHEFEATVVFYRDILGFEVIENSDSDSSDSVTFKFGDKNLWIDKTAGISQAEVWLEIHTNNIKMAETHLTANQCVRCDGIEPLPKGMEAFWVSSPSNIIHLIDGNL